MDGRMRVSVKNTFLTFDDDLTRQSSASFRSRSVECSSPTRQEESNGNEQIVRLNKVLDGDQEVLRDIRSSMVSPQGRLSESAGPSQQELRQLKQRLEEVCSNSGYPSANGRLHRAGSSGSSWSAGSDVTDGDLPPAGGMCHVRSNGSMSTITSFEAQQRSRACSFGSIGSLGPDERDGEPVEFHRHIAEDVSTKPGKEGPARLGECSIIREDPDHEPRSRHSKIKPEAKDWDHPERHDKSSHRSRRPRSRDLKWRRRDDEQRVWKGSDMSQWSQCSSRGGDKSVGGRVWQKEYRHSLVPKNVNLEAQHAEKDITTLMIRNIPNTYSLRDLIAELEDLGFGGNFDFLYIPLDKGTMANVGYAFVNFIDKDWAAKCMESFQEYRFKRQRKNFGKIASVCAAHLQGLEANKAHYERSVVKTAKLKQWRPVFIANISSSLAECWE